MARPGTARAGRQVVDMEEGGPYMQVNPLTKKRLGRVL
jgi:hypothetical protein